MKKFITIACFLFVCIVANTQLPSTKDLFQFDSTSAPRWSSFENPTATKGSGGIENFRAKGHPSDEIKPNETKILLNAKGSGIINRIWITIGDRSPEMLRSLKLEIFWDDALKPAVSLPFGDFFGMGLGKTAHIIMHYLQIPKAGYLFVVYQCLLKRQHAYR